MISWALCLHDLDLTTVWTESYWEALYLKTRKDLVKILVMASISLVGARKNACPTSWGKISVGQLKFLNLCPVGKLITYF